MKEMSTFGGTKGSLFHDLAQSVRHPEFWSYSAWLEIATKYRRSRLGILWMMAPALLYVWGMGWFFFGSRQVALAPYIAHLGVGFLVYRLAIMIVVDSATVAAAQRAFILDGRTRLTDFALRVVARAFFYLLMALPVMLPLLFMPGLHVDGLATLFSITGLLVVLLNCMWMAVIVAMAGARFTDIGEFTNNLYLLGYIFTPIMWYASDAPAGTYRGLFMRLNPIFHMIEVVRAPLLQGESEASSWVFMGLMTLFGWGMALLLYRRYVRMVPLWI